jgi:hypothetical protein
LEFGGLDSGYSYKVLRLNKLFGHTHEKTVRWR